MSWDLVFDERELPPMSAEMFAALVTARLRPIPEVEVRASRGLRLHLRVRGQETLADLERCYLSYRENPNALNPLIDQWIRALVAGVRAESKGTMEFARVASSLLPRLLTAQQWWHKREQGLRLVVRPVTQDLGVALVIDRGYEIEFVQLDAIPTWGVDAQAAYEVALANLERAAAQVETVEQGEGAARLLLDHHPDGYAAARALLPSRLAAWQARIEGTLVLGMPRHDLLLGFSLAHPAFAQLRAQVAQDARDPQAGLLANLLCVRDGELEWME